MNFATDASKTYLRGAVVTAPPERLQMMLLDGAIRFSIRGLDAIHAGNIEATFNALDRAQQIVMELMNGLRRDINPALVDEMSSLYNFIFRRLVDGNMHRDAQAVEDALRILRHQRETWQLLLDKLAVEGAQAPQAPTVRGKAVGKAAAFQRDTASDAPPPVLAIDG